MSQSTNLVTFILIAGLAVIAVGQEKEGKGKKGTAGQTINAQMLSTFEKANLTDDQKLKLKEVTDKLQPEIDKIKTDAGLTADVLKARTERTKKAADDGKKGKERVAAGLEGLSDVQKTGAEALDTAMAKLKKQVYEMLTVEQKAGLPENVKKNLEKAAAGEKKKAA